MRHGFVLGKFMPPHAGHVMLCETAKRLVDRLTILVCWLPDDPVPGPLRLQWMRQLFPDCRVLGHGASVPQSPEESPDFWPIWKRIVKEAHPEPIDFVFAGEDYGLRLAEEVGGLFVHLGGREEVGLTPSSVPLSGSAVLAAPWDHWGSIPAPVRPHFARTICFHGPESVGKTWLAQRLAAHFETTWVPEYGRYHCEIHGTELDEAGLLTIGRVQSALIQAALPWCNRRLMVDTDALMTAAWSEMMIGQVPCELMEQPKADLYLLLQDDVPWEHDGTRIYGDEAPRRRLMQASERVLSDAGVEVVKISGGWEERFEKAVKAIEAVKPRAVLTRTLD